MIKKPVFAENTAFFEENKQFSGLIQYYARKLRDPHAEGELWSFLCITKILTGDKYPDKYYAVCLRNEYIRLSKVDNFLKGFAPLEDWEIWENFDIDLKLDIAETTSKLSNAELSAIRLQYGLGYNTLECSSLLKISRQSFTRNRNRALKKMREKLCAEIFS